MDDASWEPWHALLRAALACERRRLAAAARWYDVLPAEPVDRALCDRLARRVASRLVAERKPYEAPHVAGVVVVEARNGWSHLIGVGFAVPAGLSALGVARHVMTPAVALLVVDSAQVGRSDAMALPDRSAPHWVDEDCDGMVLRVVPSPEAGPVWVADTSDPNLREFVHDGRRRRAG